MTRPNRIIYELQAQICSALAHPIRVEIVDLLSEGEKKGAELLEILKIPKANLSQHLSVLRDAGLIKSRREGLFQYFSLAIPQIRDACSLVEKVLHEKLDEQVQTTLEAKKRLSVRGKR